MSPTQRSLKLLRDSGYMAAVVEKWNPHAKLRQDLFGFIDILGFKGDIVLAVQTTTKSNLPARVRKIEQLPAARMWLAPHRTIAVHGWSKRGPRGKRKTWQCDTEFPQFKLT